TGERSARWLPVRRGAVAVPHRRTDRGELKRVGAVRAIAELDPDHAVAADLHGLGDEPIDRVHPRGVHRLREHLVLTGLHAATWLEADVVHGHTHHEFD